MDLSRPRNHPTRHGNRNARGGGIAERQAFQAPCRQKNQMPGPRSRPSPSRARQSASTPAGASRSRSIRIMVRLRAPPPAMIQALERRLRAGLDASYGRLDRGARARTIFHMQHILDQHVSGAPFRTEFPHGLVRDGKHCEHHNHGYRGGASLDETPTRGGQLAFNR